MARLDLLLSLARRRCLRHPPPPYPSSPTSPVLSFLRSFSSAAESIKPVSYPTKPKSPDEEASDAASPSSSVEASPRPPRSQRPDQRRPPQETGSFGGGSSGPWTREDFRFVKDAPSISPVSYPSRVAPLPEDRPAAVEESTVEDDQLQKEARRIRSESRVRSFLNVQEEEKVPFPTLIPLEKTPQKAPMDLLEAIRQVKANARRKFTETVEAHVNLGVDPRRGDQMVRGALTLPHGTGKTVRVAVFAEGAAADEAREAGADIVGGDDLIEKIKIGGGKLNFDKCIATPMFMPRLTKIARILGPRGLMPNPKLGSVTSDVSEAVKETKCGRVNFKIDKTAIVHVGLGKVEFSEESLRENIGAFVHALLLAKPVGLKKTSKYAGYVKNFTLCSTMGPGFPVSIQSLSMAADHYTKLHAK